MTSIERLDPSRLQRNTQVPSKEMVSSTLPFKNFFEDAMDVKQANQQPKAVHHLLKVESNKSL